MLLCGENRCGAERFGDEGMEGFWRRRRRRGRGKGGGRWWSNGGVERGNVASVNPGQQMGGERETFEREKTRT